MKYHLVTRPHEDGLKLQMILQQKNKPSLLNPLLEIKFLLDDLQKFLENNNHENVYFIVTSVNSVRAVKKILPLYLKSMTLIVASNLCFQEAQTLGLRSIVQGGKNTSDLEKFFKTNFDKNIEYVYICGVDVTIDIADILNVQGLVCKKIIVYEAVETSLQEYIIASFQNNIISSVSLFSYRTAQIFIREIVKNHLEKAISSVTIFTISKKIANLFNSKLIAKKIVVSETYNSNEVAHLIVNEG